MPQWENVATIPIPATEPMSAPSENPWDESLDPARQWMNDQMTHWEPATFGGRDFNLIDYLSDVSDPAFRAAFAGADNDEERELILNQSVGPGNWRKDNAGHYAVTPKGMQVLGLKPASSGKASVIDAPYPTMADFADLAPMIPSATGATAGAMAGSPFGPLGAVAGGMIGGMAGETLQSGFENLLGRNTQTLGEQAYDVGVTGLETGVGEGMVQGVWAPVGRKLMAPHASQLDPGLEMRLRSAKGEFGLRPSFQDILPRTKITGMMANISERLHGGQKEAYNAEMLRRQVQNFLEDTGGVARSPSDVGSSVREGLGAARSSFGRAAARRYKRAERLMGGARPVIPMQRLKNKATRIVNDLTLEPGQPPLTLGGETIALVDQITNAPDMIPLGKAIALRTRLWEAAQDDTLIPGLDKRQAKQLWKTLTTSIETAGNRSGQDAWKQANAYYREHIRKYGDALITKVMRDPTKAGSLDAFEITDAIMAKRKPGRIANIMGLLPEQTQRDVRRTAMDKIFDSATTHTDAFDTDLFQGSKFLQALDRQGRASLEALFGPETTSRMYRFGKSAQLVAKKNKGQGGLVAASIGARPIANLPKLMRFRLLHRLFQSDAGTEWLLEGLRAPQTREAALAFTRIAEQLSEIEDPNDENAIATAIEAVISPLGF